MIVRCDGTNIVDQTNYISGALAVGGNFSVAGTATGVTPAGGDNSTKFATTAFVQSTAGGSFPSGGIILWNGSVGSIPAGWYLCNGSNGTPDLRSRFVVGAGSTYAVGATGGTADAIVVSHSHSASSNVNDPGHNHTIGFQNNTIDQNSGGASLVRQGTSNTSTSSTGISVSTSISSTGDSGTNANLPPYYALCYIMKA
jgi:microcystin-dependent protein